MNGKRKVFTNIELLVVIAVMAGWLLPQPAFAQVQWLAERRWRHNFSAYAGPVNVRPGDKIVVEASFTYGPRGIGGEVVQIWTGQGRRERLDPRRMSTTIRYTSNGASDFVGGQFTAGWDDDDYGFVRIGIEPRANLTARAPVVGSDQAVSFGYRVGDRPWDPRGNYVTVGLFYANASGPIGNPIAERTLLLNANSNGWFTIPRDQIPPPPSGATRFMSWIDRNDVVPESDESDNRAFVSITNLRVLTPQYTSTGGLRYGYQNDSTAVAVNSSYVTVALFYATGPNRESIIPGLPPVHESTFDINPGPERWITLNAGSFRLPPPEATHLVSVIDRDNYIRERTETDNVVAIPAKIAPGFARVASNRGVGVYRGRVNGNWVYAVVADLDRASIAGLVSTDPLFVTQPVLQRQNWWNVAVAQNTSSRQLVALANGTFFTPDALDRNLNFNWSTPPTFTSGLKLGGRTFDVRNNSYQLAYDNSASWVTILSPSHHAVSSAYSRVDYPNLVGLVSRTRMDDRPPPNELPQTWVAVRDSVGQGPLGETRYKTLILFVAEGATGHTVNALSETFGCGDSNDRPWRWAMLDSGSSSRLYVANPGLTSAIPPSRMGRGRALPNMIGVYGGK